jgi:hypothetical protein
VDEAFASGNITTRSPLQDYALRKVSRAHASRDAPRTRLKNRGPRENAMYHEAIEKVSKQVLIRDRYDNFIGGKWVAPVEGRYFDNPSPITGKKLCSVPRSSAADIELALDAAHKAKDA